MKAYSTQNSILVLSFAAIAGLTPALAVRAQSAAPNVDPAAASEAIDQQLFDAASPLTPDNVTAESLTLEEIHAEQPALDPTATTVALEAIPAPGEIGTSVEALELPVAQRRRSRDRRLSLGEPYSYIGIGGNIGITDSGNGVDEEETPIGKGSFVINGKLAIGPQLSVRPSIIVNNDVAFLIPVTYDFRIPTRDPLEVSPFIPFAGAGLAVTSTDDNHIGFLVTGGVDYRISPQWTANGSLNVGFMSDTTDIGLTLGVGYTFPGFTF